MECLTYCLSKHIDLHHLEKRLVNDAQFEVERHWQVLQINDLEHDSALFVFANGTLVSWGLKRYQVEEHFSWIKPACQQSLEIPIFDGFYFEMGEKTSITPHGFYNLDVLVLESEELDIKLSLSYGFSQSIKLRYYEYKLEGLVESYSPHLTVLSHHGKLNLSRANMRSILANIASVKGELNIQGKFSYQPKFFWRHPNLEEYFALLEDYLDISDRTESLNQQLNTLSEIFVMFSSYLEEKHAHNLEVIIIVLLAAEIIFSLLNLHFTFW